MRVVLVNGGHAAQLTTPEALLAELRTLTGLAEALSATGAEVTVAQGFTHDDRRRLRGVDYRFFRGRFAPAMRGWRVPRRLDGAVAELAPDIVHMNGLRCPLQLRDLRRRLGPGTVVVAQHHAESPPGGVVRRIRRWGLAAVDGFFFTGQSSAEPWRRAGLVRASQPIFEIVEGSSCFAAGDQAAARATTGAVGVPIFFWAGHLDANKDPITVLRGLEPNFGENPRARLYMAYRGRELLPEVRRLVAASTPLRGRVELVGEVPYPAIEKWFQSADFFVQGSHHEGSGYALIDALACGTVPIVTDIPSFRYILGDTVGRLWPAGDSAALSAGLRALLARPLAAQRQEARRLFEQRLSFAAIARQSCDAYRQLLRRRQAQTARGR